MKNLLSLFTIFSILIFSACDDDDTPTMSTCVLYGDDPVACEKAGCTVMGGQRTVYRDGRCVAYEPFACFPRKDGDCSSVFIDYCSVGAASVDMVTSFNACPLNLGNEWEKCPDGFNLHCYPDAALCSSLTTRETCHAQYCSWVENATKAVFSEGVCTGWEPQPVSFCTGYILSQSALIYRETDEGTEMYRLGEVLLVPNTEHRKVSETPDPWSFCFGDVRFDDPICSSCPEPTK